GPGRHLVQLSTDSTTSALSFSIDDASQPVLLPAPKTDPGLLATVRVAFRDLDRAGLTHTALHRADAIELLRGVRRGERQIAECSYPAGIKGVLQWKRELDAEWHSLELPGGNPGNPITIATQATVDKINEILGTRTLAVHFAFGAFGRFCAPAEALPFVPTH